MNVMIDCAFLSSLDLKGECIQVFDVKTGANIRSYRGTHITPRTLCPLGTSNFLIAGQNGKSQLQLWALNKTNVTQQKFPLPGKPTALAVNSSGSKLCVIGVWNKLYVYSLLYGKLIGVIAIHYQEITCIEFTQCGNYFASAADDGFIYLWSKASIMSSLHKQDQPQVEPHYILGQHSDKVTGMCITSAGIRGLLMTCSLDHSVKIFDLITGRLAHNVILSSSLTSIATNSLGSQLFVGSTDGNVWGLNLLPRPSTCDIQVKQLGVECHKPGTSVSCLSLVPAGNVLISGGKDGDVKVWSVVLNSKAPQSINLSLAFQRTLHTGRGIVTNVLLMTINKEILTAFEIPNNILVSSFSTQNKESILDATVEVPIKKVVKKPDIKKSINLAAQNLREYFEAKEKMIARYEKKGEEFKLQAKKREIENAKVKQADLNSIIGD